MSLSIERRERSEGTAPLFAVTIAPAFGMGASFECLGIEVVDGVRCTEDGQLIPVS